MYYTVIAWGTSVDDVDYAYAYVTDDIDAAWAWHDRYDEVYELDDDYEYSPNASADANVMVYRTIDEAFDAAERHAATCNIGEWEHTFPADVLDHEIVGVALC